MKRDKTVRQLVEEHRQRYPAFDRSTLRTFIRKSHPEIFKVDGKINGEDNLTKLKTLDRELRKAFNQPRSPQPEKTSEAEKLGFLERILNYYKWKRQYEDEQSDKNIKELEADLAARHELLEMEEEEAARKEAEVKLKYRRMYGLQ